MICQSTSPAERLWSEQWASEERAARLAAEALNDMMADDEADFLLACAQQRVEDWEHLVETMFDARGWPADCLDQAWLDHAGMKVWKIYRKYCDAR